jgi:hypothetical protein
MRVRDSSVTDMFETAITSVCSIIGMVSFLDASQFLDANL